MSAQLAPRALGLSADDLLRLWEVGAAQHPLDRALTILAAVKPDQARRELARLPSGRRDARLLGVYARTFGSDIAGQGRCPQCEGRVEFSLDTGNLLSVSAGDVGEAPLELASEGFRVMYRLPDSFDLAEIAHLSDAAEARQTLLERCILQATCDGAEVGLDQVPDGVLALVAEQMAAHDPLAEIELALACPTCGHQWQLFFDIASFLWLKIEMQARRLLREVHMLARAYGWREADILALSPGRRQAYLEMVS
jgi:hypothetical protein